MKPDFKVFNSLEQLAMALSGYILNLSHTIHPAKTLNIGLSGGSTPESIFNYIADNNLLKAIPEKGINFFLVDERCLPLNDNNTNYHLVNRSLLKGNYKHRFDFHYFNTDLRSIEAIEQDYFARIQKNVPVNNRNLPSFDLLLTGLGADGHTASLFPQNKVLSEFQKLVSVVTDEKAAAATTRFTMTYPLINNARHIIFIVTGVSKQLIVNRVFNEICTGMNSLPASNIQGLEYTGWFLEGLEII